MSLEAGQGLAGDNVSSGVRSSSHFDFDGNLRLVPRFNERDPETFILCLKEWLMLGAGLMLITQPCCKCVLTGKAQEAYAALSVTDSLGYGSVKAAVLKTYEMVPEAYR